MAFASRGADTSVVGAPKGPQSHCGVDSEMIASLSPVAIIIAGDRTPAGKAFLDMAKKDTNRFHPPVDIRQWMHRDPSGAGAKKFETPHAMNSDCPNVAMELLSHEEFYTAVVEVVRQIVACWSEGKVFSVYCTAGTHRSDGVAKCAARVLNNWPDEDRWFNVNCFSLKHAVAKSLEDTVIIDARQWTVEPWCIRGDSRLWGDTMNGADHIHHQSHHGHHHDHYQPLKTVVGGGRWW